MNSPNALQQLRHELHTPLNHIIGFGEMVLEDAEHPRTPALAGKAEQLLAEARQFLVLVDGRLGPNAAAADFDHAKLASEFAPALSRIIESSEALRQAAGSSSRDEVERISAAVRRLASLLHLEEGPTSASQPDGDRSIAGGSGTILIVDDNEGNREMLSRRLARQGYAVAIAANGPSALELLRTRSIDVALLDVLMPEMDGYELLKQIKGDDALRHIPVLMISALDEMDSVIRCIELGAEDYLPKPFNPVLLRARIGACLEKKRLRDQEVRHLQELAEWNRTLEARVSEQVAQVERLSRLKRFLSPQLAELMVSGGEDSLKTHRRDIIVVFLDLRGFTSFAESAEPEEVMGLLRDYHAAMGELVLSHEGTLDRFTGDGMMVFFNDPLPVENPAERAVLMALAMTERVSALGGAWRRRGFDLGHGIGIAQGYATIGAIGFEARWDYSAIGTVTNLAARLCAEAKPGQILTTGRVMAAVEHLVDGEDLGPLSLKGLARPVPTFNVLRRKGAG
jgi:adenylate cyclase